MLPNHKGSTSNDLGGRKTLSGRFLNILEVLAARSGSVESLAETFPNGLGDGKNSLEGFLSVLGSGVFDVWKRLNWSAAIFSLR